MLLSHALWLSTRFYPLTPVFPFLKPIPFPFDHILFYVSLVALVLSAITPRLIPFFATFAIVLAVCDQSRLQPWFYEYLFLLLGVAFASPNACRLIIAATYFWSGAQKLNAGFINDVFPLMLEPFLRHLPHGAQAVAHPLSVAAPFIELWIGIALLGRKFRTPAVVVEVAMHVFILIALSPWGQNYNHVVWPWNIAMAAAVVLLFWKTGDSTRQVLFSKNAFHVAVLLLFGLAPMLSFFRAVGSLLIRSHVYQQYESRNDFHQRQTIRPPARRHRRICMGRDSGDRFDRYRRMVCRGVKCASVSRGADLQERCAKKFASMRRIRRRRGCRSPASRGLGRALRGWSSYTCAALEPQ